MSMISGGLKSTIQSYLDDKDKGTMLVFDKTNRQLNIQPIGKDLTPEQAHLMSMNAFFAFTLQNPEAMQQLDVQTVHYFSNQLNYLEKIVDIKTNALFSNIINFSENAQQFKSKAKEYFSSKDPKEFIQAVGKINSKLFEMLSGVDSKKMMLEKAYKYLDSCHDVKEKEELVILLAQYFPSKISNERIEEILINCRNPQVLDRLLAIPQFMFRVLADPNPLFNALAQNGYVDFKQVIAHHRLNTQGILSWLKPNVFYLALARNHVKFFELFEPLKVPKQVWQNLTVVSTAKNPGKNFWVQNLTQEDLVFWGGHLNHFEEGAEFIKSLSKMKLPSNEVQHQRLMVQAKNDNPLEANLLLMRAQSKEDARKLFNAKVGDVPFYRILASLDLPKTVLPLSNLVRYIRLIGVEEFFTPQFLNAYITSSIQNFSPNKIRLLMTLAEEFPEAKVLIKNALNQNSDGQPLYAKYMEKAFKIRSMNDLVDVFQYFDLEINKDVLDKYSSNSNSNIFSLSPRFIESATQDPEHNKVVFNRAIESQNISVILYFVQHHLVDDAESQNKLIEFCATLPILLMRGKKQISDLNRMQFFKILDELSHQIPGVEQKLIELWKSNLKDSLEFKNLQTLLMRGLKEFNSFPRLLKEVMAVDFNNTNFGS